jgi:hypothetical protein
MSDDRLDFFVRLESEVWEAMLAGDAEADRRLLSDDFFGVYPRGFEGHDEHAGHLADGPVATRYTIADARLRVLGDDTVLLAYRADYRPIVDGTPGADAAMYISSIWCRRGTTWLNVFSQDTPTTARPTP